MNIGTKQFQCEVKSRFLSGLLSNKWLPAPFWIIVLLCTSGCVPDLVITGGSFTPSAPKEGDVMNINLAIKNNGGAPANNAKISIFFDVAGSAYAPPSG